MPDRHTVIETRSSVDNETDLPRLAGRLDVAERFRRWNPAGRMLKCPLLPGGHFLADLERNLRTVFLSRSNSLARTRFMSSISIWSANIASANV